MEGSGSRGIKVTGASPDGMPTIDSGAGRTDSTPAPDQLRSDDPGDNASGVAMPVKGLVPGSDKRFGVVWADAFSYGGRLEVESCKLPRDNPT